MRAGEVTVMPLRMIGCVSICLRKRKGMWRLESINVFQGFSTFCSIFHAVPTG